AVEVTEVAEAVEVTEVAEVADHMDSPARHTVQVGDTLSHISQAYLGNAGHWPQVAAANPWLSDPDLIFPGEVVTLPVDTAPIAMASAAPDFKLDASHHMVQMGDTLGDIAQSHMGAASRWRQIAAANPWLSDPDRIFPGQVVTLPEIPASAAAVSEPASPRYVVQVGDTLSDISRVYWGTATHWQQIAAANPWIEDPDLIYPGQVISLDVLTALHGDDIALASPIRENSP
ncbi:MAG: LysM peptidoglycan-binding domain-containing protein, partial [Leptospirillia bacterium]